MKKTWSVLVAVGLLSVMIGCGSGDDHDMDDMDDAEHQQMNDDQDDND